MMIDISTEYAMISLLALQKNSRSVKISALAKSEELSEEFLRKVIQKLHRAGLVISNRGPAGGVKLAKPARQIHLDKIVAAMQGETMRRCDGNHTAWCKGKSCRIKKLLGEGDQVFMKFLASKNLYELT